MHDTENETVNETDLKEQVIPQELKEEIEKIGEDNIKKLQTICDQSLSNILPNVSVQGSRDSDCDPSGLADEILTEIPMISLGKVGAHAKQKQEQKQKEPENDRSGDLVFKDYPRIPVHSLENMDLYLTAYHNFLARWVPDLEFNYTDPGTIQGGLAPLINAIKLAFSDQYYTIRMAYLKIRDQIFKDLNIDRTEEDLSGPEALRLLERDEYRPEHFEAQVDRVFSAIQARHILDINGHRGSGYFLIWRDSEMDSLVALPTIGSFGHFLPEPGFSIVKEFGWPYFRDTEIIGFQIGHLRKVKVENPDGAWENWNLRGPIYLEVTEQSESSDGDYLSTPYDDTMIQRLQIDDAFFPGIIYGQIA